MLVDLIEKEEPGALKQIIATAALSGIANASTLAIVNSVATHREHVSTMSFVLFIGAMLAFMVGLRQSVGRMSRNVESVLCRLRIDMANWIRRSELLGLEQIGTSEIYERVTEQTSILSNSAWPLALGVQGGIMLVCTVLYLFFISPGMLIVTLAVYGIGAMFYLGRQARVQQTLQGAAHTRMRLIDRLNDLIHGFKEIRLRTQRSDDLHADFRKVATSLKDSAVKSNLLSQENFILAQTMQLALMGAAVFVLPQFVETTTQTMLASVSALLLIFGPLGQVLYVFPLYERANMAAKNIVQLQERMQKSASPEAARRKEAWAGQPFSELRLENVEFCRVDANGQEVFKVGPISLTARAGEVVFLVGGNGSGKTTLLRTMTALYPPTVGTLYVNGAPIGPTNQQAYREMIAAIFGDFHLFRKLYGFSGVSTAEVQALLEEMQLDRKTEIVDGEWKTIDLSTGQRKRLAMLTALLEDRPIYVFDEWAADQDPEFRQYFYEVLLQNLKKRGKLVIAISHDDRYFRCADQVVTLEYGQLSSIQSHHAPQAAKDEQPDDLGGMGAQPPSSTG